MSDRASNPGKLRLPLLVFFAGLILIAHNAVRDYRHNQNKQISQIRQHAGETGAQISGMAQHLFRKNLPRSVDLLLSYASVAPDLEIGLVLDADNSIRHATRKQWEGVALSDSPFAALAGPLDGARERMEGVAIRDSSGAALTGYFPFWSRPDSRTKGVIVLHYSLDRAIATAWNEAIHDSISQTFFLAAGSLMFWLILTQSAATERLWRVVDQARTLVDRGQSPLPLEGEDDLARLSRTFSVAAERIEETEHQLRLLAAGIRDVFWFVRNDRFGVPLVNEAYEKIWESPGGDLAGRQWNWLHGVAKEDRRKAIEYVRDLVGGVEAGTMELRLAMRDGRLKWVECRGFTMTQKPGQVRAIGGLVADVTERKNIERRLMEVAEDERMRIGLDLHDDVCQRMAAVQLKGGILHNSLQHAGLPQADLAAEVARNLSETTDIVRGFAHGLAPVVIEAEGLAIALSHLAHFIENAFGVRCWNSCVDPDIPLDATATTHLYRIAQELVTNAARHAKPAGIGISLSRTERSLILKVSNDGIPFDGRPSAGSKGMGLHAIRKRLEALGGRISFKASPELSGGATAICEIPLLSGGKDDRTNSTPST